MKNRWLLAAGGVGLLAGLVWFMTRGDGTSQQVEYRYAPVAKGELLLSTSSVGTVIPFTRVDVKSKAGGQVQRLVVQEGSVVQAGDLIALIDPRDTKSLVDQAQADLEGARSRVAVAATNADLETRNSQNRVAEAELGLQTAEARLARVKSEAQTAPSVTEAELARSMSDVEAQREALRQFDAVDAPQRKKDAEAALSRARVELENADRELARQKALLDRGFVSRASMERAQTAREAAAASEATASQTMQTLEQDLTSEKKVLTSRVAQSEASVRIARANRSRVFQSTQSVREAEKAVAQAKVSLRQARDAELQIQARRLDVRTAEASVARSRVTVQNASDNFRETRVVAPRPGVITRKYLEEGTIIPGAVSAFAEGTSIVEISDVTTMYVECRVDEADISNVRIGQKARIIVEAYPGTFVTGAVERIFPAAETENAVTTVRVRVKIDPQGLRLPDRPIRPGMNATVEFIQFQAANVLIVPAQAITREGDKTFVRVKGADQKNPAQVEVKVGRSGNDGVELLQGLTEGQEVVVAEIDLAAMRDRQDRMMRVQQGGLGSRGPSGPSQSRAGMGAGGGGGRPGGGGGGGR